MALGSGTKQRLARGALGREVRGEVGVAQEAPHQRRQRGVVANGEGAVVVGAEQAEVAVDPARQHRDAGADRLDHDVGPALQPARVDQRTRPRDGAPCDGVRLGAEPAIRGTRGGGGASLRGEGVVETRAQVVDRDRGLVVTEADGRAHQGRRVLDIAQVAYGDEVGVTGGEDPFNRGTYPWTDRGGKPDTALLSDVQVLIKMRKDNPVLRHGSLDAPLLLDEHLIVLARHDGDAWAITATNNATSARTVTLMLPADLRVTRFRDALTGEITTVVDGSLTLLVPALFGTALISD